MKVWIEAVGFPRIDSVRMDLQEVWDEMSSNWGQFLARQSVVLFELPSLKLT